MAVVGIERGSALGVAQHPKPLVSFFRTTLLGWFRVGVVAFAVRGGEGDHVLYCTVVLIVAA